MAYYMLVCLAVGQADSMDADSIANRYDAIIQEYKNNLNSVKDDLQRVARAGECGEKLSALLALARTQQLSNANDLFAVAQICERLSLRPDAIAYARKATAASSDIRHHVKLVQLLCASGQMNDVEEAISVAFLKCVKSGSGDSYVIHNVTALKYRSLGDHERAYQHFTRTIDLLLPQTGNLDFYVTQFRRCLSDWDASAVTARIPPEVVGRALERWRTDCDEALENVKYDARRFSGGSNAVAFAHCHHLRRRAAVALAIADYQQSSDVNEIVTGWIAALRHIVNLVPEILCSELPLLCDELIINMSRQASSRIIVPELEEFTVALNAFARSASDGWKATDLCNAKLRMAVAIVTHNERHKSLEGRKSFADAEMDHLCGGESGCQHVLIHILQPDARDAVSSRKSLAILRNEGSKSDNTVRICVAMIGRSKKQRDIPGKRTESSTSDNPSTNEVPAMDRLNTIGSRIIVLPRDSELLRLLNPSVVPINALVDREGKIVEVLTGSGHENIERLLRTAQRAINRTCHTLE